MNKFLAKSIFACFLSLFLSCSNKDKRMTEETANYFASNGITFDVKLRHCLIIPGGGCGTCVASGIDFLRYHAKEFGSSQPENLVVFTDIFSQKVLKRRLGGTRIESLNCVMDSLNLYSIDSEYNIYPVILYLEKGKIENVEVQSPYNDGLNHLEEKL